jgi:ATP-dependent DNA ligase
LDLPIKPPFPPMEAKLLHKLPRGERWQFEPRWDGFRCLVFRDRDTVVLQSKGGQPLSRYFPEIVGAIHDLGAEHFVLDGEIVVPRDGGYSHGALLQRLHPAETRVRQLAVQIPAQLLASDLLVDENGNNLTSLPLEQRRARLEAFAKQWFERNGEIRLAPATRDRHVAERWMAKLGRGEGGVIARRLGEPYRVTPRAAFRRP